jgi:hypothetical protein
MIRVAKTKLQERFKKKIDELMENIRIPVGLELWSVIPLIWMNEKQ